VRRLRPFTTWNRTKRPQEIGSPNCTLTDVSVSVGPLRVVTFVASALLPKGYNAA